MNLEQRILELERTVQFLQGQLSRKIESVKEPENPNYGDEWYNPQTGTTQVFDGKKWIAKTLSGVGPLKAGASSAFVGPTEAGFFFKVTSTGAVYIQSGEATLSLFQNKTGTANQVTIDTAGVRVRDSGGTIIFEATPTGLNISADKIRIGGKQPFHTTASGAPSKTTYTLPANVAYIPVQTADGTVFNVLVTP